MSSDPLVRAIAQELMAEWFPDGNEIDGDVWEEISYADAEVAAAAARNFLANLVRSFANNTQRHVDVGGACPAYRDTPDRCDITAVLMHVADLVGRPL